MAPIEAILLRETGIDETTATAAHVSGEVLQINGRAAVVASLAPVANGDTMSVMTLGRFRALKDGLGFSLGDTVYWDISANKATSVVLGDFKLGRCIKAAVGGDATVDVDLNRQTGGEE